MKASVAAAKQAKAAEETAQEVTALKEVVAGLLEKVDVLPVAISMVLAEFGPRLEAIEAKLDEVLGRRAALDQKPLPVVSKPAGKK